MPGEDFQIELKIPSLLGFPFHSPLGQFAAMKTDGGKLAKRKTNMARRAVTTP